MSQPRRLCVFCGGYPISKEHIWAEWMLPYLPKKNVLNHHLRSETIFPDKSDVKVIKRSGEPQSGKLTIACVGCNTGWMSDLQKATKPILIPLMRGERYLLTRKAQRTLAAWIAMFTMVAEYMTKDPTKVGASFADRKYLKEHLTVPPNWKVWIANYEGGQILKGFWVHTVLPISGEEDTPQRHQSGVDLPNTQSTTAIFDKLYAHVLSSRISQVVRKQDMHGGGKKIIPRVWPFQRSPIAWPPEPLPDKQALGIAMAFAEEARENRQRRAEAVWGVISFFAFRLTNRPRVCETHFLPFGGLRARQPAGHYRRTAFLGIYSHLSSI